MVINRGNFTDKLWYDNNDRNLTMEDYGKLNGHNFNLKELFFDKFSGIQRTKQKYYLKSFQLFCLLIIFKAGKGEQVKKIV